MRRTALAVSLLTLLSACSTAPAPVAAPAPLQAERAEDRSRNPLLYSVVWLQTSGEYRALALQAFAAAGSAIDRALADPSWTAAVEQPSAGPMLPPAVIVDIDETMLDNSPFEARLIKDGGAFTPETWAGWVEERNAGPIPGALEYARQAAASGVTIFYVSNRDAEGEMATRDNLVRVGFPVATEVDTVLLRGEREDWKNSDKGTRRAWVAERHRIVAMIGDDLGDFLPNARVGRDERDAMVERYREWWGTRWFVIPNPMYGSWEGALTSGATTPEERMERLMQALRPAR
ncbi:MAG: 5'-nucleotidase, lipoprotein e(P4) family [Thermoanaerobaculia bacterium]